MPKRKRADDDTPAVNEEPTVGQLTSRVKNKLKRAQVYEKLKKEQKRERKMARVKRQEAAKEAREKGLEPPKVPEQRTIDNTRVKDETVVDPQDEEVAQEVEQDEFAAHFKREREPQVMVTTCYKPSGIMYKFVAELLELLPCACYYKRQGVALKKIVKFASNRGFSDLVVVNEDKKQINGLLIVHLPDGPTAHFKLSSLKLGADIQGHGRATSHRPELVLNNFDTRLGQRVGRMIASLFHQDPNFKGRRVVTFHNQRDFVFVRHHRYIFEEQEKAERVDGETKRRKRVGVRLQELGPRFTLKLLSLQRGTFDSKAGEYEWIHSTSMNRHCRRKFHL